MSSNTIFSGVPILDDGTGTGVKSGNEEWFTTDVDDTRVLAGLTREQFIHFAIDTDSVVQYTLDSGSNWINFNSGEIISANDGFIFSYFVRNGDLVNIRATQALTVIFARVDTNP